MQTKLSFSLIFNQTMNFAKNRFWQVVIVSVLLGVFNVAITSYFMDAEVIEKLSTMTDPSSTVSIMGSLLFGLTLSALVVTSVSIATVYNLSISNQFNGNILFSRIFSTILKILGFNVIYAVIVFFSALVLGVVLFVLKMVLPGLSSILIVAAGLFLIVFIMTVYNFFIGAIVAPSSKNFFEYFSECHQLAKQHWRLGIGMIFINIIFLLIISAIAMSIKQDNIAIDAVLSSLSNFVDIFVICFFYRLYVLVTDKDSMMGNNSDDSSKVVL